MFDCRSRHIPVVLCEFWWKALEDIDRQLEDMRREELEKKELELKAAQERRRAIEDLEKGVRMLFWILFRSFLFYIHKLLF